MDVKLVMFKRDGKRKDFKVKTEKTVLGRGEECDLRVPLLNVSRKHCELTLGEDELRVRDLASSNGTYVNNRRINETTLKAGDRLVIGPVVFTVQIDGQPSEITPIRTKAEKSAEAEAAPPAQPAPAGAPQADQPTEEAEEVIELEPDEAPAGAGPDEESDPIAALEALAEQSKKKDEQET